MVDGGCGGTGQNIGTVVRRLNKLVGVFQQEIYWNIFCYQFTAVDFRRIRDYFGSLERPIVSLPPGVPWSLVFIDKIGIM